MKNLFKISLLITTLFVVSLNLVAQTDSPLVILEKPSPRFTAEQSKKPPHALGMVTLLVQFLANGEIGDVKEVSGLPLLTENAVEAAKRIKFIPQKKNGENINSTKLVQYKYHYAWDQPTFDQRAEEIIKRAIEQLGGDKYLNVKSLYSVGFFTAFRDEVADMPSSFVDVISYPDKERTEFKQAKVKTVQTNVGETGWIFNGQTENIRDQNPKEVESFKKVLRTSIDTLLRGGWRNPGAKLTYVGRRPASLGKRNEVIKLTYEDGFSVEYEFSVTDGMPMKSIYKGEDDEGVETKEEDRYLQFIEMQGVKLPFVIDHYINDKQTSRINYDKIELNKPIPSSIFDKPNDIKELKKDLKL